MKSLQIIYFSLQFGSDGNQSLVVNLNLEIVLLNAQFVSSFRYLDFKEMYDMFNFQNIKHKDFHIK